MSTPAAGAAAVVNDVYAVFYLGQLVGHAGAGDDPLRHVIADRRCVLRRAHRLHSCRPLCWGCWWIASFASQKVMAVMHLAGRGDPLVCSAGAGGAERRPADWPAVRLHAVLYADAGADQQHRLPQPGQMSIKLFPVVRVFGTIGWIVAGICIGRDRYLDTTGIFTLAAALFRSLLALYSLTLPHTPAPAKGTAGSGARPAVRGRLRAAQNPPFL